MEEDIRYSGKGFTEADLRQARYRKALSSESAQKAADALGVPVQILGWLGMGFDEHCYTFPIRDASTQIIGFHTRDYADLHSKRVMLGSKLGLIWPVGVVTPDNCQMITEGASDLAAALMLRFAAIGRMSAEQAPDEVVRFFQRAMYPAPTIVADNDAAGETGAEKLAEALKAAGMPCRVVKPPEDHGDLHDWIIKGGATWQDVRAVVRGTPVTYPDGWAAGFIAVPNALIKSGLIRAVKPAGLAVLMAIASHGKDKDSYPSCETISDMTGLSTSHVHRVKRLLETKGLITWEKGRTRRANSYVVELGLVKGRTKIKDTFYPALWTKVE